MPEQDEEVTKNDTTDIETYTPADGIAYQYPHDEGIENDPGVLYVEKFDDGMQTILSRYTDIYNDSGMSLDNDVPHGSNGASSLVMTNIGGEKAPFKGFR